MEIITDKQVKEAQKFFENACQKCACVFAQGYIGINSKERGDLPECGRDRTILLNATRSKQCNVGSILVNDSTTGGEVLLDRVTVSPRGPKLQQNTWASFTNNSYRHSYAVDTQKGPAGMIKVSNLRK